MAKVMKVSESRAVALACQRIIAAVASGRYSYDQLSNLNRDQALLTRIVQGR